MGLYRILVVDDETEIREGIIRKINWEEIGFSVVGSAENGLEALEKAEHQHPDVVMTDIKMPFMSGLELGERLRTTMPSVKLLFFSGFDDFEYAQQAIKLHAAEYVLKPIDSTELTETMKRIKVQLDEELNEKRNVEMLRKNYEESLPVMREQFLVGLIEGRLTPERIRAQAALVQANPSAHGWAVALLRQGSSTGEKTVLAGAEELIPISLKCTLEEVLPGYCTFTDFIYSDCVTVIVQLNPDGSVLPVLNGMNEVCKTAQRVLGTKVMAGVGKITQDFNSMRRSYREALSALEYSAVMGGDRAIYIADVEPDTSVKIEFDDYDEREIINAIKLAGEREIRERVDALFARFQKVLLPLDQYQIYLLEMTTSLLKLLRAYDMDESEIFGGSFDFTATIKKLYSPEDMKQWCTDVCIRISVNIKRERVDSAKSLAHNAQQYIQENYSNAAISVENMCEFLHVSPAYFSTVFKRETGMSFVSYLTDVRLQKAVSLLDTTQDKTYVIAQKVGFTEPNYFSYVFKKQFGVPPSKYRNR